MNVTLVPHRGTMILVLGILVVVFQLEWRLALVILALFPFIVLAAWFEDEPLIRGCV